MQQIQHCEIPEINILGLGCKQFTFYIFPLIGSGHSGPYIPDHSNQGLGCIADGGLYQPGEVFYNIAGDRCTCTITGRATCIPNSHKLPCKYDNANFSCDTVFLEIYREKEKCWKLCNWWNIIINLLTCKMFIWRKHILKWFLYLITREHFFCFGWFSWRNGYWTDW